MMRSGFVRAISGWPTGFLALLPAALLAQTPYRVSFDAQGGSAPEPDSTTVTVGDVYGPLAVTTRTGFNFEGWWMAPNGLGGLVTDDTVVSNRAEHTLYAKWTPRTLAVSFDSQGGSAPGPAFKLVSYGATYGTLAATAKPGYTLAGWWTEPGGAGTEITPASAVTATNDLVLYAQWAPQSYTVTFNAQGGAAPVLGSKSVTFDAPYGKLAETARPGYTFGGWWTEPDGAGNRITADTIVAVTHNQTLHARWSANTYIVTFNAQEGSAPSPVTRNVVFGEPYGTLPTTERPGYAFGGWWTQPGGSGTVVTAVTTLSVPDNLTLFAKWSVIVSTVTFDPQAGGTPSPASKSIAFGSAYGPLPTTTRAGYTFAGWWTEAGGNGEEIFSATLFERWENQILYANWVPLSYTVTFDAQGGEDPVPLSKTVAFNTPYGDLAETCRTGYTFGGWWTGPNGAGTPVTSGTVFTATANPVLYAKWTANRYTICFDAQGGSAPTLAEMSATYGAPLGALAVTTRAGYTFAGWWTACEGGTLVTASTVMTFTSDLTLYARWTATSCTVTFDPQGGTAPTPATKSVTFDGAYGTLAAVTRVGYTFEGWRTGAGGGGELVTAETVVSIAVNHTLYAQWTPLATTVTLDPQGGILDVPACVYVAYGEAYGELPCPVRHGFVFLGWWTAPNGTGTEVFPETIVKNLSDHVLYAKWGRTGAIRFRMEDYMAPEGSKACLVVERVNGSNGVACVTFKTKPGTAAAWSDYVPRIARLTWEDGEGGPKTIKIAVLPDSLTEPYETFRVKLCKLSGALAAEPFEANVIIPGNWRPSRVSTAVKAALPDRMEKLSLALGGGALTWFTSVQAPWTRQGFVTSDGGGAAMGGPLLSASSVSWIQTDVEGAGRLDFDWLVKGMGADVCLFLADGKVVARLEPGTGWTQETLALGPGDHTLRWVFLRDGRLAGGAAFLDRVQWTPEGP